MPDKAQSGASLAGLRAFATPYGADSRRFYSANLRFGTLVAFPTLLLVLPLVRRLTAALVEGP